MNGTRATRTLRAGLLTALLLSGACAYEAPRLQADNIAPVEVSEEGLWEISDKYEDAIAISGRRIDNPQLQTYLAEASCRVAGDFCPAVRVYPIAAPDFNASMSPNGFMQVWTGLLLRVENESQLAAVLGHEVMHYVERHSLERLETQRRTANLLMAVQFGLFMGGYSAVSSGPVQVSLGDVTNLVAGGYLAAYSREHEEQADREGLELLRRAGYAPGEAAKVWQNLVAEQEECDLPQPAALFASHPPSKKRMAYLENLAAGADAGEAGEAAYLQATLPYRAEWLRAELSLHQFCRVEVVVKRLLNQGANAGELHYFLGEVYRLRGDDGDLEKAISAYRDAIGKAGAPVAVHRELGLALRRAGRKSEAKDAFGRYLELAAGADDADMVRSYREAL